MFLKANAVTSLKAQTIGEKLNNAYLKEKKAKQNINGSFKIITNSQNWFVFIL